MQLSAMTNIHQFYHDDDNYFPTTECIEVCARAGYRALDLSLTRNTGPGRYLHSREAQLPWIEEVYAALERHSIRFVQCHGVYYGAEVAQESEVFTQFKENIKDNLRLASEFSIPWMVLHPLQCCRSGEHERQKILDENIAFFRSFTQICERTGVGIAIENMISGPFQDASTLLELLDGLGDTNLFGICWDTGHANLSKQNQCESIRLLGGNLKATHIADNRGVVDDHLLPFSGVVDWYPLVDALMEIKYAGAFSFEVHNATKNYPTQLRKQLLELSYSIGCTLLGI